MADAFRSADTYHNEDPPPGPDALPGVVIHIDPANLPSEPKFKDGILTQELPGGALLIDFSGGRSKKKVGVAEHNANLAEYLDITELNAISADLLDGIDADIQSRAGWLTNRASGLKHLALKLENPKSPSADADTAVDGQSTVRWGGLLDAVMRFQANARGELLPAGGPVKIRNDVFKTQKQVEMEQSQPQMAGPPTAETEDQAEALERDFNHYLTVVDKPYYPDTNRMFFMQGFGGSAFKKVYSDPILRRPVSRAIDAEDIIVSNAEVSLHECGRVTHRVKMRQSTFRRMELAGTYKEYDTGLGGIGEPGPPDPDEVERAKDDIGGFAIQTSQRPADYRHTIYECYCELDVPGFGHKEKGKVTGLPLPYRVTIEKDSQKILEIRRNWREDDDRYIARMPIVKYPFVEAMSFYGVGLLDIMGNGTAAVSAAWRLALDSAGFSSWPGFLYSDSVGRQDTMSFRVPLGGGVRINAGGMPLRDAVLPLPYKDVTTGLVQVTQHIEEETRRVGGTPEIMIGEGRADVPVGTTIAMLDQAMKVINSVHKGMHIAQSEEFSLLRDLFVEDPEALICNNPSPSRKWEVDELRKALSDCNLSPQADPNTPSHTIRVMKAVALTQMVQMKPDDWDTKKVAVRVAAMVGLGSITELQAPPPGPQAQQLDPKIQAAQLKQQTDMAGIQAKLADIAQRSKDNETKNALAEADTQLKFIIESMKVQDNAAERQSRERIEVQKDHTERLQLASAALIHPQAIPYAQQYIPLPPMGRRII